MSVESGILLMLLCIVGQGFFAGTEIALMGADRLVLRARAAEGDPAAARVLAVLAKPTHVVSTCLAGVAVASVAGTTILAILLARITDSPTLWVAAVYPPITVTFCELIPKSLFHQYATLLAPRLVVPVIAMSTVLRPVLWVTEGVTRGLSRLFGMGEGDSQQVRREDIQLLLDNSPTGDIHAEEREMIQRVFGFSEKTVRDAMVPLIEVVAVPETATVAEATAASAEHGFSRLPVFRKRVDRIVGVVMHSDLLFAADAALPVGSVMHDVVYVPETKSVDQLFLELRRRRQRLAVVVDEYGGAVGVISIEDILEELVGDIEDEFDRRRPLVRRAAENEWVASARIEGEALRAITGFSMPDGDYETLAGFMLARLGHVPSVGEKVTCSGWVLEVKKSNERAILEVSLMAPRSPFPPAARP